MTHYSFYRNFAFGWWRYEAVWLSVDFCVLYSNITTEALLDTNLSTSQPQGCSFFFNHIFMIGVSWWTSTWALDLVISLHLPHIDGLRSSNILIWTLWFPTCYQTRFPSTNQFPGLLTSHVSSGSNAGRRTDYSSPRVFSGTVCLISSSSKGGKVPVCVLYHSSQHPRAGFGTINFLINPPPHIQSDASTTSASEEEECPWPVWDAVLAVYHEGLYGHRPYWRWLLGIPPLLVLLDLRSLGHSWPGSMSVYLGPLSSGSGHLWPGRSSVVMIGGRCSAPASLLCGVPQGSILGPVLFLLSMLPLGSIIPQHNLSFHFYADDVQIHLPIKPKRRTDVNTPTDCIRDIKLRLAQNSLPFNDSRKESFCLAPHRCGPCSWNRLLCSGLLSKSWI